MALGGKPRGGTLWACSCPNPFPPRPLQVRPPRAQKDRRLHAPRSDHAPVALLPISWSLERVINEGSIPWFTNISTD